MLTQTTKITSNDAQSSDFTIPDPSELTKIETNKGDTPIYFDSDGHVYLWPASESIPTPIKERSGDDFPTQLYNEWNNGENFQKVHSVSKKEDGTYQIVITENHGDGLIWGIIPASATGILNWESSLFSDNIGEIEERVQLDLNEDGEA